MEIHLPEDLQQFVREQVNAGRFASEGDVVRAAVDQFRQARAPAGGSSAQGDPGPLWGMFRNEPELIEQIVAEAMRDRQTIQLRAGVDG